MSYQKAIQLAKHRQAPLKPDRFVKISERQDCSDLPESAWKNLLASSYLQTWKDLILVKGVTEITLYPMLLHELKPQTIIEIGAFNGGSAVWFADLMQIFDLKCEVYSMDIDLSLVEDQARQDPRIQFLQGDSHHIEVPFPSDKLASLPHPWLITEDAHVNSIGILNYFHEYGLQPGDYIIIEDTNPFIDRSGIQDRDIWTEGSPQDSSSAEAIMMNLRNWLNQHENEYLIDTYYLDMYGYNVSKNWNSVLKRV